MVRFGGEPREFVQMATVLQLYLASPSVRVKLVLQEYYESSPKYSGVLNAKSHTRASHPIQNTRSTVEIR